MPTITESPPQGFEGGCFCGAVRYRARSAPSVSMVCHCRTCRRIAGAPAVAWLTLPMAAVSFIHGAPQTLHSSPGVTRSFCAACGTHLSYQSARTPDEIDLSTCTADDPDAFPPTHHSWLSHGLAWTQPGDGLPRFARARSDGAPA